MLIFLTILVLIIYGYNIYVIKTQIIPNTKLSKHEKMVWSILLIIIPLFALWFHNYLNSKMSNKNIFRY